MYNSCVDCDIYKEYCNGERFVPTSRAKEPRCKNRVASLPPESNNMQVEGFYSFYRWGLISKMDKHEAFIRALVFTNDEVWQDALEKRPHLIKKYLALGRKARVSRRKHSHERLNHEMPTL